MPPKPKKDDYEDIDDDAVDLPQDDEEDEEEFLEDDFEEEKVDKSGKRKSKKDKDDIDDADSHAADDEDDEDDLPVDSDIEEDDSGDKDFDVVEYMDEDETEPPVPEIVRNTIVIKPEDRTTSERLSNFECARVLGERARHIDNGAPAYINTTNFTSSLEIAHAELMQKKLPMAVIRHVGHNSVEIWRLRDMIIPKLPPASFFVH